MRRINEQREERILRSKVKDTVLSENMLTAGNINDYTNLALRLNTKDKDGLQDFIDNTLEQGVKYKVVISTDDDVNAEYEAEARAEARIARMEARADDW